MEYRKETGHLGHQQGPWAVAGAEFAEGTGEIHMKSLALLYCTGVHVFISAVEALSCKMLLLRKLGRDIQDIQEYTPPPYVEGGVFKHRACTLKEYTKIPHCFLPPWCIHRPPDTPSCCGGGRRQRAGSWRRQPHSSHGIPFNGRACRANATRKLESSWSITWAGERTRAMDERIPLEAHPQSWSWMGSGAFGI